MFENINTRLISRRKFYSRGLGYFLYSMVILGLSLGMGMVGY